MHRRFLNNKDYLGIITEEALNQLIRNNEYRFVQAEQAAEASILDYLLENYEVEEALEVGKRILDYNKTITYPVGSYMMFDGEICEVISSISGQKRPMSQMYWLMLKTQPNKNYTVYSQLEDYTKGDIVKYGQFYYTCLEQNGISLNDVRIPDLYPWEKVQTYNWEKIEYDMWEVVKYDGNFYALIDIEDYDFTQSPFESPAWGLIGKYDPEKNDYSLSETEYVVYNNEVFFPVVNPNHDIPKIGENLKICDPRNYNLKRHMVQLALYELHKLISPHNISNVRIADYESSMKWLKDASRLKINPQIKRRVDKNGDEVTDWQMSTYATNYDPEKNPWHV